MLSSTGMTPGETSQLVKSLAAGLGFDRVGVAPARPVERAQYYSDWLARGHAGSMTYLQRNAELRCDPAQILPGARAIVCTTISYNRDPCDEPLQEPSGRVSRYARGDDYHVVIRRLLETLITQLRKHICEPFDARAFVDTGPVLERELAAAAGLGWIGKNTLLMHERLGSYLFLGEIVTTLELEPDSPATDHCGTCTRCIDACPTGAFPAPYQLDASRCVSYLTIENRGAIPEPLRKGVGDWVFGCDVCQEVCPHNSHAEPGRNAELLSKRIPGRIPLSTLVSLTSGGYRRLTEGTAARRSPRQAWQRNAAIALANQSAEVNTAVV
ncbi:MAG: tRNA epoxyqueuosine(34) reductase QueG [Planctomycetes bacterium]|nr:tRNA epoxyqueuosine(34) reductase QueG [Planctomycetota bacterium]